MKADIITIGNEILIGQIVDTNSAWIAQELTKLGIEIRQTKSIADSEKDIFDAIENAKNQTDIIIFTGGLGPTNDDITKETLAKYFKTELVRSEEVFNDVKSFIEGRNLILNEQNIRQADVPKSCKIIRNNNGTAAGMWFEQKGGAVVVSMPAVPFEMKEMMLTGVIPMIKQNFKLHNISQVTVQTFGLPESLLAQKIADWENNLPEKMQLAYLPSPERIRLRLTCASDYKEKAEGEINCQISKLKTIIGKNIFAIGDKFLHETIGEILREKGKKVTTAESCTGGNIARLIVSVPNSSDYFDGGVVAYSNEIKHRILGVKNETLEKYGAVSQQTVEEMALGVLNLYKTDYAIAVSGIAGPSGATEGKPVGTTWIAVCSKDKTVSQKFIFGNRREINIRRATSNALNMLRLFVD